MAKQRTKKEMLVDLFHHARMDLPEHLFTNWLSFCYGIFEHAAGVNRRVEGFDIALISGELERLLKEAGFKKMNCKFCGILSDHEFCNDLHAIKYQLKMDQEVEQESRMAGKVV